MQLQELAGVVADWDEDDRNDVVLGCPAREDIRQWIKDPRHNPSECTEDGDLLVAKLEVRMTDCDEPLYSQTDRQQYRTCQSIFTNNYFIII